MFDRTVLKIPPFAYRNLYNLNWSIIDNEIQIIRKKFSHKLTTYLISLINEDHEMTKRYGLLQSLNIQ